MRVLIAGAAGAIGIRLVSLLVSAGHSVVGLTRSSRKADAISRLNAAAVVVDALDREAIRSAVLAARPDVLVHELTDLGASTDLRRFDRVFAATNRLRTAGLDYLVAAAKEGGTRRVIAQSFCGWPYERTGGPIKSETDPLDPRPPKELRRTLDAIRYLETTVVGLQDQTGIVLRYGAFYGPDTGVLAPTPLDQLERRRFPLIGNGNGWWSFVHVDDAAAATALAVERGAGGIYNVVDSDPAPVRVWLPALAAMVRAASPVRLPKWLARGLAGNHLAVMMTEIRAGSNSKALRELGWQLKYESWRRGFAETLASQRSQHICI